MKYFTLTLLTLALLSCSGESSKNAETTTPKEEPAAANAPTTDRSARGSVPEEAMIEPSSKTIAFNGSWFSVSYPDNFKASPLSPKQKMDNYAYVETDEATFVSPDGTVEFFVYSPQWSGDPKSYLEPLKNERIESDKTEAGKSEDAYSPTHHWVTFVDKEGKYTRSFHSKKSEVTHLVFGIKYTSVKHYERYKAAYNAFKKSLMQYAD